MLKGKLRLPLGLGGLGASGLPCSLPLVPVGGTMGGEAGAWWTLAKFALLLLLSRSLSTRKNLCLSSCAREVFFG